MIKDVFKIFLFLLVISLDTPCSAQDNSTPKDDLDAAQQELSARPAVGLPQWKSSLQDIQRTAADLLATNAKLTAEYQKLELEVKAAGQAILAQKDRNKEQTLALMQRQHDLKSPLAEEAVGSDSAVIERAVLQKREALQNLRAKARALQNRLELQRIRLRELDLEKRSLMVDVKLKSGVSAEEARAEIEALKVKIASIENEEKEVWAKIHNLPKKPDAGLSGDKSLVLEVEDLKQQLAQAFVQEKAASSKLAGLQVRRKALESDPKIATYNRLLEEKRTISARLVEQQREIGQFERNRNVGRRTIDDLKDKVGAVDKQNKSISEEIENLRENIALLEYKINSMQNYQGRNKKGR